MFDNTCDPITLEPIFKIPASRKFKWCQQRKRYCVDIESIYHYIHSGNTINPWAIDKATGHDDASNREEYLKQYDMKNVRGLLKRIDNAYEKLNEKRTYEEFNEGETPVSESIKNRFAIENICPEMYKSHIINYFEAKPIVNVLRMFDIAIVRAIAEYRTAILTEMNFNPESVMILENLEYSYYSLMNIEIGDPYQPNFKLISYILCDWNEILNKNAMMNIFDTCINFINTLDDMQNHDTVVNNNSPSTHSLGNSIDSLSSVSNNDEQEEVFAI